MKKFKNSMLVAAALLASTAYAGGPDKMVAMPQAQDHALFATVEGGYSWNSFGDTNLTYTDGADVYALTPSKSLFGGTGRIAFGAAHQSTNPSIYYTGELGWGYYGKTDYSMAITTPDDASVDTKNSIYGLDLLAGIGYKFNQMFEGFLKIGGLLENIRMVRDLNVVGTNTVSENETTTSSAVIPEIKVGGLYNIDNDWALSASYMHAFGNGDVSLNVNKVVPTGDSTTTATAGPVSLNTVLAGVVYKFD